MGLLLARVADLGRLRSAWADVLGNDQGDGVLGTGVARFAEDAENNLAVLAEQVQGSAYRPGLLTRVEIPREGGGPPRGLQIPGVRDRIVERAVLEVLTPVVDPCLGAASYGYRPGIGVADAVQAIARLRDEGMSWVARTDIADCFPSIPVGLLKRRIAVLVDDPDLLALIEEFLGRRSVGEGGQRAVRGLAQGSPLSPMWANLVLVDIDERVSGAGFPVVRYADDMAVLARDRDDAWEAMRMTHEAADELGLHLGADKSEVMSFEEGFCFLGEDFGPRYPPALEDHRLVEPTRRVVYVAMQGSRVRVEAGRLVVETPDDQEVLDVPNGAVERIVFFGAVGLSAGARSWALATGVDLVFLSRRGTYLGHGWAAGSKTRVARLRAQLAVPEQLDRVLVFGRAVVEAKIRKQLVLVQRFTRPEHVEAAREATGQMRHMLTMVTACGSRDELMGVEGAAARAYFGALGALVPEDVHFVGRSRQPPLDLVNAALSYGYAILLGEAVSALCAAGLDPAIGFLHADHERRPSLALDLMEEFRPMVVDQVVVSAARRRELRPEHGRREDGVTGVLLTKAGREALIGGYERRMLRMTGGALPGFSGSLRRHLYRQAERLAAFVHDEDATWTGLSWR